MNVKRLHLERLVQRWQGYERFKRLWLVLADDRCPTFICRNCGTHTVVTTEDMKLVFFTIYSQPCWQCGSKMPPKVR